jgi:hypothetical protein
MEPQQTAALVRRTQRGLSVQARAFGATAMPRNVRTEYYRGVMHRRSGAVAKDKHDPCGGIFSLKGFFPNDECLEQILLEQGRIKRRLEEEKEREIEQTEQVRRNLEQKDREEEWVPLQAGTLHCDVRTGVRRGFVATLQRIPSILPGGCQKVLDSFGLWHYLPKVGQKIMTIVRRQKS